MLGATAGLRLLPEGKADIILQHVRQYLEASPFQLVADGVRVIDGTCGGGGACMCGGVGDMYVCVVVGTCNIHGLYGLDCVMSAGIDAADVHNVAHYLSVAPHCCCTVFLVVTQYY